MIKSFRIILIVVAIVLSVCNVVVSDFLINRNKIIKGVYFYDFHLGGKTREQCKVFLKQKTESLLQKPVCLIINNNEKITLFPRNIDIHLDINKITSDAYLVGRGKNKIENIILRYKILRQKRYLDVIEYVKYNKKKLKQLMEFLNNKISTAPRNADFKIENGNVVIVPSMEGQKLDENKFQVLFNKTLFKENNRKFIIPVEKIKPALTTETAKAMQIEKRISSFSTAFDPDKPERVNNIIIGVEKLNKLIIAPGEVFSFNEMLGPRSYEMGYQKAPAYINKEVKMEVGGGICQVSSTLYNLVLKTDLKVIERTPHSRPVDYVVLGLDATVYYDEIDFKFKNNTNHYLLLHAQIIEGQKILMEFYGSKDMNIPEIRIVSQIVEKIPPGIKIKRKGDVEQGEIYIEKGKPGYRVRVWKIIENKREVEKEFLHEDVYHPVETIVYVPSAKGNK